MKIAIKFSGICSATFENPQGYMIKCTSEPKLNSNHRLTDCVPFSGSGLFDIFHP